MHAHCQMWNISSQNAQGKKGSPIICLLNNPSSNLMRIHVLILWNINVKGSIQMTDADGLIGTSSKASASWARDIGSNPSARSPHAPHRTCDDLGWILLLQAAKMFGVSVLLIAQRAYDASVQAAMNVCGQRILAANCASGEKWAWKAWKCLRVGISQEHI